MKTKSLQELLASHRETIAMNQVGPLCDHKWSAHRPARLKAMSDTFYDCCNLEVNLVSTGPEGGDGSRTDIELKPIGAHHEVTVFDFDGKRHSFYCPRGIRLTIHGDAESRVLLRMACFLRDVLVRLGFGPANS